MTPLVVRLATGADTPTVAALWTQAAAWIATLGSDQWQYPIKMHNIHAEIAADSCWIFEERDGTPVAIVTLDDDADPDLWQPDDHPDTALYAHRLVVRPDRRGQHVGAAILDWASRRARTLGRDWLRLDVWTTNTRLHRYYLNQGFRLVRIVHDPDIVSGAMFERPADQVSGRGPMIVEPPEDTPSQ